MKSGKPFRAVDEVVGASEKVSGHGMAAEVERPGQMCIWRGSPWRAGFQQLVLKCWPSAEWVMEQFAEMVKTAEV